jgi:hypothetical protein
VDRSGPHHLGDYGDFDREMAAAIGVPVVWEDREPFHSDHAPPGTLECLKRFIEGYRRGQKRNLGQ